MHNGSRTGPILVTGATGNVGSHVVSQLLRSNVDVRALARDPPAARLPAGVEAVRADLTVPGSLTGALTGVDTVFLLVPTLEADQSAAELVQTLAKHVRRIVYLSANGVPDDPTEHAEGILGSHATLERLIVESGIEWTFLRPTGFATNTLRWADEIRAENVVRDIYGAATRSLIHERDIAEVAAHVLTEDGHHGRKYVLSGPRALSQAEQARLIGEAAVRPVRFEETPPETARERLLAAGMPAEVISGVLSAHEAWTRHPEIITSTVEEITGKPARPFEQWAAEHAADFR